MNFRTKIESSVNNTPQTTTTGEFMLSDSLSKAKMEGIMRHVHSNGYSVYGTGLNKQYRRHNFSLGNQKGKAQFEQAVSDFEWPGDNSAVLTMRAGTFVLCPRKRIPSEIDMEVNSFHPQPIMLWLLVESSEIHRVAFPLMTIEVQIFDIRDNSHSERNSVKSQKCMHAELFLRFGVGHENAKPKIIPPTTDWLVGRPANVKDMLW